METHTAPLLLINEQLSPSLSLMTVNDAVGSSPSTVQYEEDTEEAWEFCVTSRPICKLLTAGDTQTTHREVHYVSLS